MTQYQKNLFVGLTVLVSLILVGTLIVKFGDAPAALFGPARVPVSFSGVRADGLSSGATVYYLGVNVGQVTDVQIEENGTRVLVKTIIDRNRQVPANVSGFIRSALIGNTSSISLEPEKNAPAGAIADVKTPLPLLYRGNDLLPSQFTDLAEELRRTTQQFRESNLVAHLDQAVQTVQAQVEHAGKTIDSIQDVVGDQKLRDDLKAAVTNIKTATETANRVSSNLEKFSGTMQQVGDNANVTLTNANTTITKAQGHVDELSKQVGDRLEQISKLLDNFQSISAKIDKGQGTAGMLVNDPKLYQGLVDTTQELKATITDLKLLVDQWTEEGAHIKLAK